VTIREASEIAGGQPDVPAPARPRLRPLLGLLADGTPCFVPVGEVGTDGQLVICHLCGRSLRSVAAHLRVHGWTKAGYCEAFGLERGQSLEADQTRKLRAAAFSARLVFEPAVRRGSAAGRARAVAGELARDAADAATGRPVPQQRQQKVLSALRAVDRENVARANAGRAAAHNARVASEAARGLGFTDIGQLVVARVRAGASLAAISREAGLGKDWLSRHLAALDPAAAAFAAGHRASRGDTGLLPAVIARGFTDVASYLRARHDHQHVTVHAIACELGVSHQAVATAMRRNGVAVLPHAAKRHAAAERAAQVAAGLGQPSVSDYVRLRRAAGATWRELAAESGQPQSWLRRQAGC
jgi:hypothetical protein